MNITKDFVSSVNRELRKGSRIPIENFVAWADYVELLCLFSDDNLISIDEAASICDGQFRDLPSYISDSGINPFGKTDFADKDDDESLEDLGMPDTTTGSTEFRQSEINDKWFNIFADVFRVLKFREGLYKSDYPFIVSSDSKSIFLKSRIKRNHQLYTYFLLCTSLRYFKKQQPALTSSFEVISATALKSLLPTDAIVSPFHRSHNEFKSRYKGNLSQKIDQLCGDLCDMKAPLFKSTSISKYNTGDGGLDLVAFVPTYDNLPSKLIYLAQCGCTDDWPEKQFSSTKDSWGNIIHFTSDPISVIFIPHCFRSADGTWLLYHKLYSAMYDRKRLLARTSNKYALFKRLPAYKVIHNIFLQKRIRTK